LIALGLSDATQPLFQPAVVDLFRRHEELNRRTPATNKALQIFVLRDGQPLSGAHVRRTHVKTSKRDRDLRQRQSKGVGRSLSLSVPPVCLPPLGGERKAVVGLRVTILRDNRDDSAGRLVASGGMETDRRAIPCSRDATLIQ